MKKSFGSSKSNRSISKPSSFGSKGSGKTSSKKPLFQTTHGSSSSKGSFKDTTSEFKEGSSFLSGRRNVRSNRPVSLVTLLVLFVCCLVVLCLTGVYLVSQGLISIPSIG